MTLFNFIINTFSAALDHATAQPNVANLHALIDHAVAQQNHSPQQSPGTNSPSPHQPQPPQHNHKVPSPNQSCPQFQPLPVTNAVKSDLDKSSVNCASLEEHTVEVEASYPSNISTVEFNKCKSNDGDKEYDEPTKHNPNPISSNLNGF